MANPFTFKKEEPLEVCMCERSYFRKGEHPKGHLLTIQITEDCTIHFPMMPPLTQFYILTRHWDRG